MAVNEKYARAIKLINGGAAEFDWNALYEKYGKKYNISPVLLKSIFQQESNEGRFNLNLKSGAAGPGQMMPLTAKGLGVDHATLYDPETAVDATARLLVQGDKAGFGTSVGRILSFYYGGPDISNWGPATEKYSREVTARFKANAAAPTRANPAPTTNPNVDPARVARIKALTKRAEPAPGATPPPPEPPPAPVDSYGNEVPWGVISELGNGLALGYGPELNALAKLGRDQLGLHGPTARYFGLEAEPGNDLAHYVAEQRAAQERYRNDSPLMSTAADIGGSLVPVAGAEHLIARGIKTGTRTLERLLPRIAPNLQGLEEVLIGAGRRNVGTPRAPMNMTEKLGARAAAGARQGAIAGAQTAHMNPDASVKDQAELGALVGGAANPLMGAAGDWVTNRVLGEVEPELAWMAQRARAMGIPIRYGQLATGTAKSLDTAIHGSKTLAQLRAFTRRMSNLIGEDTDNITQDTVAGARRRLQARLNAVTAQARVAQDPQFTQEFTDAVNRLTNSGYEPGAYGKIKRIQDFISARIAANNGVLPGQEYLDLVRPGGTLEKMAESSDLALRESGQELMGLLQRAARRTQPQAVQDELQEVMQQRDAMLAFKNVYSDAHGRGGLVDPSKVEPAARAYYPNYGQDPLPGGADVLAQVGRHIPSEAPAKPGKLAGAVAAIAQHPLLAGGPAAIGLHQAIQNPTATAVAAGGSVVAEGANWLYKKLTNNPRFQNALMQAARDGESVWNRIGMPNPLLGVPVRVADDQLGPAPVATAPPQQVPMGVHPTSAGGEPGWPGDIDDTKPMRMEIIGHKPSDGNLLMGQ